MAKRKGWYEIPGVQDGDRTLAQQVLGLESLRFEGKTVLELGCAEGLMTKWMVMLGASFVLGVDVIASHIAVAEQQCAELHDCAFQRVDLNDDEHSIWPKFDIVMALAVLHKLKKPGLVARRFASVCKETMVIRLPPETAPVIIDTRSGNVPYDIDKVMRISGFTLEEVTQGHYEEWTGRYVRLR